MDSDGVRLTEEQRLDWLRLIRSENVGPRTFRSWSIIAAALARRSQPCPSWRGAAARRGRPASPRADAERELEGRGALGVTFVALGEPDYPLRLQMIDDAPPLLSVRGNPDIFARPTNRNRRLPQRICRWREIRRSDGERSRCGRLRHRLRSRTRHRRCSTPRQPRRPARSPFLPAAMTVSIRAEHVELAEALVAHGAAHFGDATRMGAACPRLSAPQPFDFRSSRSASSS